TPGLVETDQLGIEHAYARVLQVRKLVAQVDDQLAHTERGHEEQQTRLVEESSHDEEFGDPSERGPAQNCNGQTEADGNAVVEAEDGHQQRAERAELALREVDDAGGLVDEYQAERNHAVRQAFDEAAEHVLGADIPAANGDG